MASKMIFDFGELATPAVDDVFPIIDVSDTTQSTDGSTKKITYDNLMQFIEADITTLNAIKVNYTNKLSALAATTSAELAGVITDETGSGLLVFGTQPTLDTPTLNTPKVDHIDESTSDHGVVIDSAGIKDGSLTTNNVSVSGSLTVDNIEEYTSEHGIYTMSDLSIGTSIPSASLTVVGDSMFGDDSNYSKFDDDGKYLAVGNARIYKSLQVPASSIKAPGTNPPSENYVGYSFTYRFSASVNESISFTVKIPSDIDLTEKTSFVIGWCTTATTGNVKWQVEYIRRKQDEDVSVTTPDETLPVVTTVSSVANGYNRSFVELLPADADDVINILRITRLSSDDEDTCAASADFVGASYIYVSNKFGVNLT